MAKPSGSTIILLAIQAFSSPRFIKRKALRAKALAKDERQSVGVAFPKGLTRAVWHNHAENCCEFTPGVAIANQS